jgi:hypothetical protein
MNKKLLLLTAALGLAAALVRADSITLDFENDSVTGGSLNITSGTSGATDSFTSPRFDNQISSTFEITGLPTYGTLTVTATGLGTDLSMFSGGLGDGTGGYNATGEGTSFIFSEDVTITGLDWTSFTVGGNDSVSLYNGTPNTFDGTTILGTYADDTVSGGIDFTNPNSVTMNVTVLAGDAFSFRNSDGAGDFYLGDISLTVIPEPSSLVLVGLAALAVAGILRSRKR